MALELSMEAQDMGSQMVVEGVASLEEGQLELGSRSGMTCGGGGEAGLGPLLGLRCQREGSGWYSMSSEEPSSTHPEGRKKDAGV